MPRVLGRSFIHVNDVDHIVEHTEDLLTIQPLPESETANHIHRPQAQNRLNTRQYSDNRLIGVSTLAQL